MSKFDNNDYHECNLIQHIELYWDEQREANKIEIENLLKLKILKRDRSRKLIWNFLKYDGYILHFLKDLCERELLYFFDGILYIYDPDEEERYWYQDEDTTIY